MEPRAVKSSYVPGLNPPLGSKMPKDSLLRFLVSKAKLVSDKFKTKKTFALKKKKCWAVQRIPERSRKPDLEHNFKLKRSGLRKHSFPGSNNTLFFSLWHTFHN